MKRIHILLLVLVSLSLIFCVVVIRRLGIFAAAQRPVATSQLQRGNFGRYLYTIGDLNASSDKLAQFEQPLPSDDGVVVPALKSVASVAYGITIPDAVLPVVETIQEVNVVTFSSASVKYDFELFRNSHGEVGSVRLWQTH
jgi:hypothetical protein